MDGASQYTHNAFHSTAAIHGQRTQGWRAACPRSSCGSCACSRSQRPGMQTPPCPPWSTDRARRTPSWCLQRVWCTHKHIISSDRTPAKRGKQNSVVTTIGRLDGIDASKRLRQRQETRDKRQRQRQRMYRERERDRARARARECGRLKKMSTQSRTELNCNVPSSLFFTSSTLVLVCTVALSVSFRNTSRIPSPASAQVSHVVSTRSCEFSGVGFNGMFTSINGAVTAHMLSSLSVRNDAV